MANLELSSKDPSMEQLWPMYKNAKNLLPYRYRMENLIWRMMFVKSRQRSKGSPLRQLELSSLMQTPLLGTETEQQNEDFNYVAHIRKMSEVVSHNLPTRKRPAPMSPFMQNLNDTDSFSGLVRPTTHSKLSAAFKGKTEADNNGYSFQLDSFTLEGPQQSDFSQPQRSPFHHESGQSLPSTITYMPTSELYGGPYAASVDVNMKVAPSAPSPHFTPDHTPFSGYSSTQAISVPNPHFPANKRKTPSSSYDPSSFAYPVGPASILSDSLIKQENSLVSVSDHFASSSMPYTPYEFDDQASMGDSYFPGMINKDVFSSNTPLRGSLAGPRMYEEPDSRLTFFDGNGQGNGLFKQTVKLPHHNPDDKKPSTNFWIDDYFNDSSSPHGSVSTSASGTSGLNGVSSFSQQKGKKPKPKKPSKLEKPVKLEEAAEAKSDGRPVLSKQNSKKNVTSSNAKTPNANNNIECTNCFTKTTPLWRRNPQGEPLCNACGLFLKLHGTVRPLSLKTDVIKKRQRGQAQSQSTRKPSSAAPQKGVKNDRDGDDFSPAPLGRNMAFHTGKGAKSSQHSPGSHGHQTRVQSMENSDDSRATSAGQVSPNPDILHPINELVKDEWDPVEQGDSAMFDGSMAENKNQWDWLSMNI